MSAASSQGRRQTGTDVGAPKDPFNGFLMSHFLRDFSKKVQRSNCQPKERIFTRAPTDRCNGRVAGCREGCCRRLWNSWRHTQPNTGTQNHTEPHTEPHTGTHRATHGHTGTRSRETQRWRQSAVGRSTESTAHVFVCLLICSNIEKVT